MKKLLCILLACLCITPAFAEGGMFVPDYNTFMDRFYERVSDIDPDLAKVIYDKCRDGGKWVQPKYSQLYDHYYDVNIEIEEAHGFLSEIKFKSDMAYYQQNEAMMKELLIAATTSLLPDQPQEFYDNLFDDIQYEYIVTSPATSITIYKNFGVFQYYVAKYSTVVYTSISLSLFEY